MRKAKRSNRLTALALSVLMVLTMTPVTASAQGVRNDGTAGEITAFENLAEEIRWQSVEYGTAWEELNLPQTLSATVEGEAAEVPVDWKAEPAYDASTKGLYLLTAQLAEGFSATAELPYIAVVVRAEQPKMQLRGFGGGAQETDPFLIGTAAQLAEIATLTNEGQLETMFLGQSSGKVYLKLDNDIDLSAYASGEGWVPIGWNDTDTGKEYAFKGSFDGGGHIISGLYINRSDSSYLGLFGYVESSMIKNFGVVNAEINAIEAYIGGVAGSAIKSTTIENCFVTGSLIGDYAGGIAGSIYDGVNTIKNCYFNGTISAETNHAGGIVGFIAQTTVENCYTLGILEGGSNGYNGGIVGYSLPNSESAIKNCAALQEQVIGSANRIYRVLGYKGTDVTLQGNIAFAGMTINGQTVTGGESSQHGLNVTAADIKEANFFQRLFGSDDAWTYETGKLPGFGAAIEMPGYIIDISGAYFNGAGTVGSPYEISTPQQLAKLAELVNDGDTDYNSKYYILTSDLDLSAYGKNYNDSEGWVPIGEYRGNFDGNYKTITGLYINRASIYQGLFGAVYGTVKNLGVVEVDISGRGICGGITGCIFGTVENCFVTGKIHGSSSDIGGIAGVTIGTVKNCYSSAEISSSSARVGGIAGQVFSYANVENCYSSGSVSGKENVGGIAGVTNGTVRNCAALNPSVAGKEPTGRVGVMGSSGNVALENNIAFDGMTVTVGGNPKDHLDEGGNAVDGLGKSATELYNDTDNILSNLFTAANGWTYTAGNLPILTGFAKGVQDASMPSYLLPEGKVPFEGAGTESSPYLIKTAQDLARLAELVNSEVAGKARNFGDKCYTLMNDIDLSGIDPLGDGSGWVPIGNVYQSRHFQGVFDGQNHKITGLYINRPNGEYQGLFGHVVDGEGITPIIKNLSVINTNIASGLSGGGIVGIAYLDDLGKVGATRIQIENCYFTGSINCKYMAGGIVGHFRGDPENGVIRNCSSEAILQASAENEDPDPEDNLRIGAGGIVGAFESGTIEKCYSASAISGAGLAGFTGGIAGLAEGLIQNCYATGDVNGSFFAGGIAGMVQGGAIKNSYVTGKVSGEKCAGGVGGLVLASNIENCAALQSSVSGTNVSRIIGSDDPYILQELFEEIFGPGVFPDPGDIEENTLSHNFAFDGMVVTMGDNPKEPLDEGHDRPDGLALSSAKLFGTSFWTTADNWETAAWSASIWDFADGKLPILKDTDGKVMPGQSGAPDLYLVQFSTDSLTITLSGPSISGDGQETPYTCPAHNEVLGSVGTVVNISVSGMEDWTNPDVSITVKQKDGDSAVDTGDDFNGRAHFSCPANFSGDIIVTAAAKSNPNNEASVTLTVNKRDLMEPGDFMYTIPADHTYDGTPQGIDTAKIKAYPDLAIIVNYDGSNDAPVNAGTYAVTLHYGGDWVYNPTPQEGISIGAYIIAQKGLTITGVTATERMYDGTTSVTLSSGTLDGVVSGDSSNVSFTLNTGTIADANVGDSKEVITNITLTGDRADNYTLTQPTDVTVNIAKKALTLTSATVADKEYDGSTTATVTGVEFNDLVGQEMLTLDTDYTATGMFSDVNTGTNISVTVTPSLKDTERANNYSLSGTVNATASIARKQISFAIYAEVTQGGSGNPTAYDAGDTITVKTGVSTPADATISYTWYRNDVVIEGVTGNTYTIGERAIDPAGSIIVVRATPTGNYKGSEATATITLIKIPLGGSISIEGDTALGQTLTINTNSLTPSEATTSIIWLRDDAAIDGETGSAYTITKDDLGKTLAAQVSGTGEYSGTLTAAAVTIPAIAPEAPANFTASAGNGLLTLNWTAPFDGGSAITKYQLSTDDGESWQDIGIVSAHTITGLTNGTAYTVKLRAVNGIGEGPDASVTATPVRPYSGGDGGGSSNDNSSSVIVTPPAPDQPNAPTQGEIKVSGTADGSGNLTASITEQSITAAIDRALAQARQSGAEQNGISLVLNVGTGSNQPINSLSFNLPKAVQDALIAKGVASVTFAVGNQNNTMLHISIDLAALKEISRQANGNVNLTATRINSGKLTGEGKKAIGSRPVFDLKASYGSGRQVQNFGAGSVSVTIPYVLGAGENAGNIQAVYVDANGKVQWLVSSVYDRINGVLRFSTNHFSTYGVGYKQDAPSFTDIGNHWAKDDIAFVANRGLFSGTSETTFSPNTAMTRGMFVTALGRLANADVSGYKKSSFTDVKSDAYYMGYIEWANQNGIVNGIGNGRFAPDQSITREQMAVMMSNYAKVIGFALPKVHAENTFADSAKISAYAKEAVKQMQMAGVISGKNSNLFDPQGTATRAEVSAVLRRFVELAISSDTAQGWTMNDSGKWMYFKNGKPVTGKNNIDGSAYTFDQYGVTADVPKNLRYTTYTVQKGDSFWLIAHKLGCTMSELERLNNKSRFDLIHPGDVLRVPENKIKD